MDIKEIMLLLQIITQPKASGARTKLLMSVVQTLTEWVLITASNKALGIN